MNLRVSLYADCFLARIINKAMTESMIINTIIPLFDRAGILSAVTPGPPSSTIVPSAIRPSSPFCQSMKCSMMVFPIISGPVVSQGRLNSLHQKWRFTGKMPTRIIPEMIARAINTSVIVPDRRCQVRMNFALDFIVNWSCPRAGIRRLIITVAMPRRAWKTAKWFPPKRATMRKAAINPSRMDDAPAVPRAL